MIKTRQVKLGSITLPQHYSDTNYMLRNKTTGKLQKVGGGDINNYEESNILITDYENCQKELIELEAWFDGYYNRQMQEYARSQRLGVQYMNDDYTIEELDNLAENNKARINELRKILKL